MSDTPEQSVMDTFVELADTLTSDYDISDFLHTLVERCTEALRAESGGVLLESPDGTLDLAAATSPKMRELEDLEMRHEEGPCLEAYQTIEQVLAEDLREQVDRWPRTAPKAMEIGLLAAYAFPLRWRDDCIGALNLYRESPGPFRDHDVRLAQAFADVAAIGIIHNRKLNSAEQRAGQLQTALDSRVVIERATGILTERYGMELQEAFETIRQYARSHNRKLREVCQEIVDGGDPVRP